MDIIFEKRYTEEYGEISFSYAFDNDLPGSAAGVVSLSCARPGVILLF